GQAEPEERHLPAGDGPRVLDGENALDVETVRDQDGDLPAPAGLQPLDRQVESVVDRRAAVRRDPAQAEGENRLDVGEGRLEEDVIGKQQQLRLVERGHGGEETSRTVHRLLETAALHAGARVHEQHGGEGYVSAAEGDDRLRRSLVGDGKVVLLEVEHGAAVVLHGDEELLEVYPDLDVGHQA